MASLHGICCRSAIAFAGLLLAGCTPLDAINPLTKYRAGLTELEDEEFPDQRRVAHARFAQRIGSGFSIVGTRDFVLEDESSIAQTSNTLREVLQQDEEDLAVERCTNEYETMADRPMRKKMYWRGGRCRYAILDMPPGVQLANTQNVLVTLYEVVAAAPGAHGRPPG